ncbi:hypothetical protein G5714_017112 [Onychostoma macrolepis]|uniref:SH3 domain-containing YSC84-like protein 1 n=2 Tax=Onychostoma macrolepis TaxID=369639 RepID=A0A7J6C959_9TELE|nr:hypothetical protein G5714_017112 [Onychostoma macrolepis]
MSSVPARPRPPTQRAASSYTPKAQASAAVKPALYPSFDNWDTKSSDQASGGALVVTAVHPFTGQQPGDLSFVPGDRITVITKTDSQYDWWEGELRGQVGIFPANFVSYS